MNEQCSAKRSDGAQCEDKAGHYGSHVWPELDLPILRVGDRMQMFVELIEQLREQENPVTVRVREIHTAQDGLKTLWLEKV